MFLLALLACAHTTAVESAAEVEITTLRRAYANVHLVKQGDAAILIDAGYADGAADLAADLEGLGVGPANLRAIVVTHAHSDHAGGAGWFQAHWHTPVYAGADDLPGIQRGTMDPLCPTSLLARQRHATDQAATFTGFAVDRPVAAPTSLRDASGIDATIHPLPGHTPGSVVVTAGTHAFVGDLFRGTLLGGGITRHFYMCDLHDNEADVAALLSTLAPNATRFAPGHFATVDRAAVEAWVASPD